MGKERERREIWPRGFGSWAQVEGLAFSRVIDSPKSDGREYRRDQDLRRKMAKV